MTSATAIQVSKPNIGVYTNPKHVLSVREAEPKVDDLVPGPGEVTINVKATGICGSDVHFHQHGHIGNMIVKDEQILGHESSGVILAVGEGVTNVAVGDRVAIEPGAMCMHCEACLVGKYNGCVDMQFKSTPPVQGLLRRYVKHPAHLVFKIGDMSFEEGALLEPLSVSLYGIESAGLRIADPVVVCGAGPIGLVSAILARAAGAAPLVITDISQSRLDFAKKVVPGIRTVLVERGVSSEAVADKIVEALGGEKARVAIECTGVESSLATAIYSVKFAGTVQVIGVGKDFQNIPFMHASVNDINIKFQYRYVNTWPKCIRLVNDKVIDVKALVTHRFNIEDAAKAFATTSDPTSGSVKVMIFDE